MTLDPKRTAFVFPGQGSQVVGMGKALAGAYPEARRLFEEMDSLLGIPLTRLCWEGPDSELGETLNTQPALLTHSVAAWRVLTDALGEFQPLCVAGHSMREFSGLVAAGALPLAVVIAVEDEALARGMALALRNGARRAVRLNVSIGSHSPLMRAAAAEFARAVNAAPLADPRVPLIGNVGAGPLRTAAALREDINAQLTSPVRWVESVRAMQALGADTFIELGSKDVLTGLIKRIDPAVRAMAAGSQIGR